MTTKGLLMEPLFIDLAYIPSFIKQISYSQDFKFIVHRYIDIILSAFNKRFALSLVLAIAVSLSLVAQNQSYILFNGTVITPDYTSFSNPKRGVAYFKFDDQYIVEIPAIKYIEYDTLRYRLSGLFKGSIQYQKRIINGPRLDIYTQEYKKTKRSPFKNRESNKVEYFFEKDEELFKTFTYNHLKWAIIDDPETMSHLRKANKYRWIQLMSVALGAYATVAAIQQKDFRSPVSMISVTLLSLIPVTLAQKPKRRILNEAVDIYNRPR
jgi:hypothetical protein